MRKVKLYIATSVDGYIARENGDVSWLDEFEVIENEDFEYQALYDSIDTTLMGNNTYKEVIGFGIPFPYPDKQNFVFSRSKSGKDENVTFINDDIASFTKELKQQPGKDIWLIGGGEVNTIMMNNNLVDEIIITITPIVLGKGIPLFAKGQNQNKLKLIKSRSYPNGFIQLNYECS